MVNVRRSPQNPVIIIPARMASTRLPRKPLADIAGEPMIIHTWRRATASGVGNVVVACDDQAIVDVVHAAGGRAVLTRTDHPSGSDRIWEALKTISNAETFDAVINVQGDEPTIDPSVILTAYNLLNNTEVDIGTLAAPITDDSRKSALQVCKAVVDLEPHATHGRALYFSRHAVPSGEGPLFHHVGLYAYRRDALEKFVNASPSPLEKREKLEQLRALSLGLRIEVAIITGIPLGVDTPEDLEATRAKLGGKTFEKN